MIQGRPYLKYKDSGIPWLGEIPEHWEAFPIKRLEKHASYLAQTGPFGAQLHASDYADDGVPLILIKHVNDLKINEEGMPRISPEKAESLSAYRLDPGDIVFSRVGSVGRIAIASEHERGWLISGQMLRLRFKNRRLLPAFAIYAISSSAVLQYFDLSVVGTTRDSINTDILRNLPIPLPNHEEQRTIASFLDRETGRIDELVGRKERLIELLREKRQALISHAVTRGRNPQAPLKDSGIPWLGKIPEHWEVRKLKHISSVRFSSVDKKSTEGERPVRLCNYVDVYYNDIITPELDFMEATASPDEVEAFDLQAGDVLITKDSESWDDIAIPAYIPATLDGVICGYHLARIRPRASVVDGKFLFLSFKAGGINHQYRVAANGITRYGLGKYRIDNSSFLVPPIEEQRAIVSVIDQETGKIAALMLKLEESIERLKEYRTALISSAVTGKIDVRGEKQS
jgi:restriction endonuclease S subunit